MKVFGRPYAILWTSFSFQYDFPFAVFFLCLCRFFFFSKWCSDFRFGGMLSSILPKIGSLLVFKFRTYLFSPNYVTVLQRITFFLGQIYMCVMLLLCLAFKSGVRTVLFFSFSFISRFEFDKCMILNVKKESKKTLKCERKYRTAKMKVGWQSSM